jgi:hypothetical protein
MRAHIRRCVECPKCRTRYLIGFSPYANGSSLLPTAVGSSEEYTLYCACCRPPPVATVRVDRILDGCVLREDSDGGKPFDYTVWFSDTYVRTPNGWSYAFGQSSLPLPPETLNK